MSKTKSWTQQAADDARTAAENFIEEIVERVLEGNDAVKELYDYYDGDQYHHENHADVCYDLTEAAEVLDELSDHEETDSGLWDSLPPRDAVCAQAAYTYGNAVMHYFRQLIEHVNDEVGRDEEMPVLLEAYNGDGPDGEDVQGEAEKAIRAKVETIIKEWRE